MKSTRVIALLVGSFLAAPVAADINAVITQPGGSNGSVQYKRSGSFAGDSVFTYSTATNRLTVSALTSPLIAVTTITINGLTYYFPTSQPGGAFLMTNGAGGLSWTTPSTSVSVSTGVTLGVFDGGTQISSPTLALNFSGSQFIVSLQGTTTAAISLDPSSVTILGPLSATSPVILTGSTFSLLASSVTMRGPDPTLGGDLSGTVSAGVVADDSHLHTGSTISGLDISQDTNLAASDPITLTGDTVGIDRSSATLLGPSIEAAELPSDGYASTYVNVTGDTMTGQLTVISSVTVSTIGVSGAITGRTLVISSNTILQGATFYAGTVQLSTVSIVGPLSADASVGTSGMFLKSQGSGSPALWATVSGVASSLGVSTGGVIVSSPTPQIDFNAAQFSSSMSGTTVQIRLVASSVTLRGTDVINLQSTLQSGATLYTSSGTVLMLIASTMTVLNDIAITDDATIGGGLTVSGGSGITVASLTPSMCVETDGSGKLVSASAVCGSGGGGGSGTINASTQGYISYYSVSGSSNVLSGSPGISVTTITATSTSTLGYVTMSTFTAFSGTILNLTVSTLTLTDFPVNIPLYVNAANQLDARAIQLDSFDVEGVLPVVSGGTGQEFYANGVLLIGNAATGGLSTATLTAGSNVTITNSSGAITIASSGGGGSGDVLLASTQVFTGGNTFASSTTYTSTVTFSSVISSSFTSVSTVTMAGIYLDGTAATLAFSSGTITTLNTSNIYINMASAVIGANATITSTMSVVLASAPVTGEAITITLPSAATNPGISIMVYKVDRSTGTVFIIGAGADVIEGTGTIALHAFTQRASLISLGASGWASGLGGIQQTPTNIGAPFEGNAGGVQTASNTVVKVFDTRVPTTVTGFRYYVVGGSGGFGNFGIYDKYGTLIVSTGPVVVGTFGAATVSLAIPVHLPPGQYYTAFQPSNASISIGSFSNNSGNGGLFCSVKTAATHVLPNPYAFPGGVATSCPCILVLVNGGKTGL